MLKNVIKCVLRCFGVDVYANSETLFLNILFHRGFNIIGTMK